MGKRGKDGREGSKSKIKSKKIGVDVRKILLRKRDSDG
jgi:hypothetical protein